MIEIATANAIILAAFPVALIFPRFVPIFIESLFIFLAMSKTPFIL